MIQERLLVLWADYRIHQFGRVFIKGVLIVSICGTAVSTPFIQTAQHKQAPKQTPPKVVVQTKKVATTKSAPKPQPAATPATTAPATPVQQAPAPVAQPTPVPASQPAPGSGAKTLAPAPTTPGPTTPDPTPSPTPPASDPTPPAATGGYTSTNWSGYVALAGSYTAVSGSWIVPAVTGNGSSVTAESSWIGIGGVYSSDLIQTGTENIVSAGGRVSTGAFYELLPGAALLIPSLTVSAGDSMSASITLNSGTSWQISITDNTTGQNYTTAVSYSSSLSSAEWIEEDPSYAGGSQVPYANYSSVSFNSGTATRAGSTTSINGNSGKPITMVSSSTGQPIAVPSVLTGNGGGFIVTRS